MAAQQNGIGEGPQVTASSDTISVKCGPLLNYRRMEHAGTSNAIWHGSVLIVTAPGQSPSKLSLKCVGGVAQGSASASNASPSEFTSEKLYSDPDKEFWRFTIDLPVQDFEARWEYSIHGLTFERAGASATKQFAVPSSSQSMRFMFHSCNGFSVGTDIEEWSGCCLWNDVMRQHEQKPIHVMIGGGDQIYNDWIRTEGPLKPWTQISNPKKRRDFPFSEQLREDCDKWYYNNYATWYSTEPFSHANGTIPQVNVWDDHDIIDGFGSYTDGFMKCAVFRGIGGIAHKYYLLFQQHLAPPASTFTTDEKATLHGGGNDPQQLKNAWVATEKPDPMYLIGKRPGPYVEEASRSLFTRLGARMALLGIDARTERTRHQINYPDTYQMLFEHVSKELMVANGQIKHLILLLGVPIAYPRLQWLENILQSPLIGPIQFLHKRFGVAGGLFNQFDGGVDLVDDLDDHYTSAHHKKERRDLMLQLQEISKKFNVRVTILGGDVHLAAFGRFYSSPKLEILPEHDHRFMGNIISSAITNHPPPGAVANLLARRNKIHHLDHHTDETLLNLWDKDPGEGVAGLERKSAANNNCTMPSRNYAIVTESNAPSANGEHATPSSPSAPRQRLAHHRTDRKLGNPRDAIHAGEDGCGVSHAAADPSRTTGLGGQFGLDVSFRVEINHSDLEGHTKGYGLTIPGLELANAPSVPATSAGSVPATSAGSVPATSAGSVPGTTATGTTVATASGTVAPAQQPVAAAS